MVTDTNTHNMKRHDSKNTKNSYFSTMASDELYYHINIPKCIEINRAYDQISITFQNINGKFGSKTTATPGQQDLQKINTVYIHN